MKLTAEPRHSFYTCCVIHDQHPKVIQENFGQPLTENEINHLLPMIEAMVICPSVHISVTWDPRTDCTYSSVPHMRNMNLRNIRP